MGIVSLILWVLYAELCRASRSKFLMMKWLFAYVGQKLMSSDRFVNFYTVLNLSKSILLKFNWYEPIMSKGVQNSGARSQQIK